MICTARFLTLTKALHCAHALYVRVSHNSHKKEHHFPVLRLLIGISKGSALCSLSGMN